MLGEGDNRNIVVRAYGRLQRFRRVFSEPPTLDSKLKEALQSFRLFGTSSPVDLPRLTELRDKISRTIREVQNAIVGCELGKCRRDLRQINLVTIGSAAQEFTKRLYGRFRSPTTLVFGKKFLDRFGYRHSVRFWL